MKYILVCVFFISLFCSCETDDPVKSPVKNYLGYFPLDQGRWVIYDVDSIVHLEDDDATNRPDTSIATFHFQIMEVIDESFTDGEGNEAFRISRFKRQDSSQPWDFQGIWIQNLTFNSAQRVEDNIRYVKLAFPFSFQATWNGNAYNSFLTEDYLYSDIHVPSTIGSLSFDSTVTVLQLQDFNLIHRIFKQEKYANHVGLIYKQKDSLNINGIGQVKNGIEFKETISSYGQN